MRYSFYHNCHSLIDVRHNYLTIAQLANNMVVAYENGCVWEVYQTQLLS